MKVNHRLGRRGNFFGVFGSLWFGIFLSCLLTDPASGRLSALCDALRLCQNESRVRTNEDRKTYSSVL